MRILFEYLKAYQRVIVTGPQRSGTTITARIIAHDTGLEYVDEQAFRATDVDKWRGVVPSRTNYVMQAPGMCRYVHEFGACDDLAVVLVRRSVEDIEASQKRVGWNWDAFELDRYGLAADMGPIAQVKYDFWDSYQRALIKHPFEIAYEDLAGHPLWVSKDKRGNFGPRQWYEVNDDSSKNGKEGQEVASGQRLPA